jgi:fimbrial chaperone protein
MERSSHGVALGLLCCALWAPAVAVAGEFTVNPILLELGAAARSGAITVRNDGKIPLSFQLQAMEWVQDAGGKDQYLETRDLIFYPKILTIEPGKEGLVRVGTRTPIVPVEKTYRLFIEELPGNAGAPKTTGTQISFLIRFGAPIFVKPVKPQEGLEIEALALTSGELAFSAKNTGNEHQVIQDVHLKGMDAGGNEIYAMALADRYILAGTVKSYKTSIPAGQCAKIATIEVELKTDKLSAKHKLDVTRAMCAAR